MRLIRLQIRPFQSELACSNLSKGFLVLHIFFSLSSQALNCFPLGAGRMQGVAKLWLPSNEMVCRGDANAVIRVDQLWSCWSARGSSRYHVAFQGQD